MLSTRLFARSLPSLLLPLLLLSVLRPAHAITLRICTTDNAILPYLTPEGTGTADLLVRMAAEEVGLTLEYHAAPLARCREEVRRGSADGLPASAYLPALQSQFKYPMRNGDIDTVDAVASGRMMVFRRVGSNVDWDGNQFTNLNTKVMAPFGMIVPRERLQALNVAVDTSGKTMQINFSKILAGRSDVAIALESHGAQIISAPPFAGKIEMLPTPFSDDSYYFVSSPQFYEANGALMEKLWDAIGRIRRSPAYLALQRKALDDLLRH